MPAVPASFVTSRGHDVRLALMTFPDPSTWRWCACLYAGFIVLALPIAMASGLLHPSRPPLTLGEAAALAAMVAIHPVLVEEILFRALLLPRSATRATRTQLAASIVVALGLYVIAHPISAWLFRPDVFGLFSNPFYLALTTLLGLCCIGAYLISGSIWPSAVIHWLTVVVWILLLGGNALLHPGP
jgi:predicted Abi (CAAX) family protease